MPIDPTAKTLSYYITFQSSHINPNALVKRTLKGALCRHSCPTKRKSPLTTTQLQSITAHLADSCDHDDMLFLCMLNTGFPGLLHLGEMAVTDNLHLRDFEKLSYEAH
jgi:hypothetical protein